MDVLYWNVGCKEVDYVLREGSKLAALEVKSADADSVSGMREFKRKYPQAKNYLIGGQGMPFEMALAVKAKELISRQSDGGLGEFGRNLPTELANSS